MPSGSAFTAARNKAMAPCISEGVGGGVADDCSRGCASDGERARELAGKGKR